MNKSQKVLEILRGYQYKNTSRGIYAFIDTSNGLKEVSIKSEYFYSVVANDYQKENDNQIISQKIIKECIFNYQGELIRTLPQKDTSLRIQMDEEDRIIRIDIGDPEYHYYEITSKTWKICSDGYKYFTRNSMQAELPIAKRKGNIELLFNHCRIPKDSKNVFLSYVGCSFIDIIHPCLIFEGVAGSSKSTVSTMLKMLIDPCVNNAPCIFPKNLADLKYVYSNQYFAAYDNLEQLNTKQSNLICSVVTGSQEFNKKLYANYETNVFNLRQPVVLNGISNIATKNDLLERAIVIELPAIDKTERKSERSVMRAYEEDLPSILGGILNLLVKTLATYEYDAVKNPNRLADFEEYGYYFCEAWKKGEGKVFREQYDSLLNRQLKGFKKNTHLVDVIVTFLSVNDYEWEGTMANFTTDLKNFLGLVDYRETKIPSTPNRLSREMNKLESEFKKANVIVEKSKTRNNSNYIRMILEDD